MQRNRNYQTKEEFVDAFYKQVLNQSKQLVREYWNFITRTGKSSYALSEKSSPWEAFFKFHELNLQQEDVYDFTGIVDSSQFTPQNQKKPIFATELDVFKNYKGFDCQGGEIPKQWNIRFSNKALGKLRNMKMNIESTMKAILSLQLGYMCDSLLIERGPILYLAGFSKQIKGEMQIIYALVPERVPKVTQQTFDEKTQLVGFEFRQYLRIIDIVQKNSSKGEQVFEGFVNYIMNDPDKWSPFQTQQFEDAAAMREFNSGKELLDIQNIVNISETGQGAIYKPKLKSINYLSKSEVKYFQFTNSRWLSEQEQSKLSFSVVPNLKNINREIIDKCTSQESCEWLLSLLYKLPNFNLKLTKQEELLVTCPGNVLCLGRSGTGKTTSAVLRLFALELLFKVRSSFFFKKDEGLSLKDSRNFTAEDAESQTGLHSVVVTASPVLTNEIRRFYQSFKDKIISALKRKEKKEDVKVEKEEDVVDEIVEDDEILDVEETEKNMNMANSMGEMKNEDFPAFLTIKRLVYMIDGSLSKPFFVRNAKKEIIGQSTQAQWHNEQKGILMINNYFKQSEERNKREELDDIDRFMESSSESEEDPTEQEEVKKQISGNRKRKAISNENAVQEFAQEIDFEVFQKKFWPKYEAKSKIITCAGAWTEIFSIIKGSHNSCEFPLKALPYDVYSKFYQSASIEKVAELESRQVYSIYEDYEQWKRQVKGFDFMDIVNHLLRQIASYNYFGSPIHFMVVDEVQDLTPATIKLLLKVTEQNVYFAGDTAQTIARGVGFRFCDLKKMVNMSDFQAPKVIQLSINFRSHNQILTLANSIISAIEIFFPQTIDKLLKEKSKITGLKPIVLDSSLLSSLFYILTGDQNSEKKERAEFGCDQVIIVRDQESKKKIPSELQHALCLTVYECKGLEFEDVILFNFFTDSKIGKHQWSVMHDIKVKKTLSKKQDPSFELNRVYTIDELNMDSIQNEELKETENERGEEYESSDKFYVSYNRPNMIREYNALCTELKQLYVCITRPKKRLIIYDEETEQREQMLLFWNQLGAVDHVTSDMISKSLSNIELLGEEEKAIMRKIAAGQTNIQIEFKSEQEREEYEIEKKKGWKRQGIKMFKRRFYEPAIKCFENANEIELKQRAEAYNLAEKGSRVMSELTQIQNKLSDLGMQLLKSEKRQLKSQLLTLRQSSVECFSQASEIFVSIGLKKQAAQCYFTAEMYIEAAQMFENIGFYAQAGESYYILKDYSKAAMLYSEGKAVTQAVECYKKLNNWDAILGCVKINEQEFSQEQREMLIEKYVPLALNSLYHIVIEDQFDDGNGDESEQMVENQQEEGVIQEASSDEEEAEDSIREEALTIKKNQVEESMNADEQDEEIQIDTKSKPKQQKKVNLDESVGFDIISEKSQTNINSKIQDKNQSGFEVISDAPLEQPNHTDSFDHLSFIDPDDEFLNSRPSSVIRSLISGEYRNSSKKSALSSYSIVVDSSEDKDAFNVVKDSVNIINTKRDIYGEDLMMAKIVYYISQFSMDVQSHLSKMKSKEALLSNDTKQQQDQEEVVQIDTRERQDLKFFQDLDLDEMDDSFVRILLDGLESFELYKLCIIVCNRYKLRERIGRYLVSIAHKYSNLPVIHSKFITIFHKDHKQVQEQVSFIAHQALHSALELIDPEYLKVKNIDKSLGQYTYTALFELGFWKKLVYLMSQEDGLSIASSFADFQNYKQLYLTMQNSKEKKEIIELMVERNNFKFLRPNKHKEPTTYIEYLSIKTALDSVIWQYNDNPTMKIQFKFPRFMRLTEQVLKFQKKECGHQQLFNSLESVLSKYLLNSDSEISYTESIQVYDASAALSVLMYTGFKDNKSAFVNLMKDLNADDFSQLLRIVSLVVGQFNDVVKKSGYFKEMMYGMMSVLKVMEIKQCEGIYDNYGDKVLVHCTSPLALELTKDQEDKERKLREIATKQVFANNDVQFMTKKTLNKKIREQVKEAMHSQNGDYSLEVIDLESSFLRVPLKQVVDKILHKISSFIKKGAISVIDIESYSFNSKQQIDELESPFHLEDSFQKQLIAGMALTAKVSEISSQDSKWQQQYFKQQSKKILGEKNKERKIEKLSNYQIFLLNSGVVSEEYLMKQKKQMAKKKEKKNLLMKRLSDCIESIAFVNTMMLKPITKISQNEKELLLELGKNIWQLFIQTLEFTDLDQNQYFNYAIQSLSIFISADSYLQFIDLLKQTLNANRIEYKLLYLLIDTQYYKKCGNLQESVMSEVEFLKQYQKNSEMKCSTFYIANYLEMAIVNMMIGYREQVIIPFEMCRHATALFSEFVSEEEKTEFIALTKSNEQISITFKNSKYSKWQQQHKAKQVLSDFMKLLRQLVEYEENKLILTHVFLMLMTLVVNMPEEMQLHVESVFVVMQTLEREGIILKEHSLFEYETLSIYVEEMKSYEIWEQNEVLFVNNRDCQSVFVSIFISDTVSKSSLYESMQLEMLAAEDNELVYTSLLKIQPSPLKPIHSFNYESLLILKSVINEQNRLSNALPIVEKLRSVIKLNNFIHTVFLNNSIDKVFDFHYLLTQREKSEKEMKPVLKELMQSLILDDGVSFDQKLEGIIQRVIDITGQVNIWSYDKYSSGGKILEKNQKIMKLKWKEHALRMKQRVIQKGIGKKKAEYLQAKKERIKKMRM